MKSLEFIPYKSIGTAEFGMVRDSIREIFGDYSEFRKNELSKNTTDDFGFIHAYYDNDNMLEAIECFGEAKITLHNEDIMKMNANQLETFLDKESIDYFKDEIGIQSDSIGLSAYIPEYLNKKEAKVESLLFFRKGYYD